MTPEIYAIFMCCGSHFVMKNEVKYEMVRSGCWSNNPCFHITEYTFYILLLSIVLNYVMYFIFWWYYIEAYALESQNIHSEYNLKCFIFFMGRHVSEKNTEHWPACFDGKLSSSNTFLFFFSVFILNNLKYFSCMFMFFNEKKIANFLSFLWIFHHLFIFF